MAAKVKKGDRVVVLAGRDKGKQGEVTKVMPQEGRVIVSGVNVVTRHQKPNQMEPGGIKRFEAAIDVSTVSLLDPKDGKPTRVGFKIDEHGRKIRIAKRSGEAIDV